MQWQNLIEVSFLEYYSFQYTTKYHKQVVYYLQESDLV